MRLQGLDDPVVRGPVAGGPAERRIDDEVVRVLADREHVLQKPQQAFLAPAAAAQLASPDVTENVRFIAMRPQLSA